MSERSISEVSVIVPTCDRADMTRRCLDALAAQTHRNFETIVIDDGSVDETPAMLEAWACDHGDFNLKVLRNESNLGANASRNRGVQIASAELIAFLDSDCLAEPDWLENIVRPFVDKEVGAVTGLVLDPDPRSIYDLTFRGTHRVARPGPARRLVAGNMCVRRRPLLNCMWNEDGALPPRKRDGQPDVGFSGACDEESLTLALRADGWTLVAEPDARVLHEHFYDRAAFFKQAYYGGRAAAAFVRRNQLPHRIDMIPFALAWMSLPPAAILAIFLGWPPLIAPVACFAAALAAIAYNDVILKGKTLPQTARTFPMLIAYYHVRLVGYTSMTLAPPTTREVELQR